MPARTYSGNLNLLPCAIPPNESGLRWSADFAHEVVGHYVREVEVHPHDKLVFVRPGDQIEGIEDVVPSAVWLEPFENWFQRSGDGLAVVLDDSINIELALREGEVVVRLGPAEFDSGAVYGLVERVSEIVDDV